MTVEGKPAAAAQQTVAVKIVPEVRHRVTCPLLHEVTKAKEIAFEKAKMSSQKWECLVLSMDTFWVFVEGCGERLGLWDVPRRIPVYCLQWCGGFQDRRNPH